jgi:DNA-binding beta-propeller fold protein YncE
MPRRALQIEQSLDRTFILLGLLLFAVSCADTQAPAAKPAPPPFEFVAAWGAHGADPGQLSQPVSLATDTVGNVFVVDAANRYLTKFDAVGHPLLSFGIPPHPASVAVDLGGAIYVGSSAPSSVSIYFPQGELIRQVRGGRHGLKKPVGIAVDDEGDFYVADAACQCIQKFNPRGRSLKIWGHRGLGPGEFDGLAAITAGGDGNLYVLDGGSHRVQKFARNGSFAAVWSGAAGGLNSLEGIVAVAASDKYLFLADAKNRAIQVRSFDGALRWTESLATHLDQAAGAPIALSVTPKNELFVLDGPGARVLKFRLHL